MRTMRAPFFLLPLISNSHLESNFVYGVFVCMAVAFWIQFGFLLLLFRNWSMQRKDKEKNYVKS